MAIKADVQKISLVSLFDIYIFTNFRENIYRFL